jgi:hypothetical protein
MGCSKFWNYTHLLQVSHDGEWMDGRKFPASLDSYATIRKSNSSGPIDRQKYNYLDAVHMDIAFGDCLSVGIFWYALILVDCATWYNWVFGLKNLLSDAILAAIRLFHAAAGSLVICFIVTVTSSSLALPSASTSLTTTPKLLQHQPNGNPPMVCLIHIGRS